MPQKLKIGELASRARVTAKAIRFYEAQGVLPPARRGPNGYRLYTDDAAVVLAFIKQAGGLGLDPGPGIQASPHFAPNEGGTRAGVTGEERSEGVRMEQVELRVRGMSCTACEQRIQRALAQVDGVVRSAADHGAEHVQVVFDPTRTSAQAVRARIEQAGYEVSS